MLRLAMPHDEHFPNKAINCQIVKYFLLLFPRSAIQCILVPGILNECWQPARRRTTGVIVTTGEELMTPVSLRGCRSAVKVILIEPLEAPLLKLCQQQPSSLKQIKKTLKGSIIFYLKKMNGFFFQAKVFYILPNQLL